MPISVVLDACVLLPYQLSDLLLRLAEANLYLPVWSDAILGEVERNLLGKFGQDPARVARRLGQMQSAFPAAAVTGYEALVGAMTNDPKDRHVAAVAVRAGATVIVTANLKDFPAASLDPYGIVAVHPDEFLLDQLDLAPATTVRVLEQQRGAYRRPPMRRAEFRESLRVTVPEFVEQVAVVESALLDPAVPLPLVASSAAEASEAFFPGGVGPDGTTALGVATTWWLALRDPIVMRQHLDRLSEKPAVWGDYVDVAATFAGLSIAQNVHPAPGFDDICYVKFIPGIDGAAQVFAEAVLPNVLVMTLTRSPWDGLWRVWGVSWNLFPNPEQIQGVADAESSA